MQVCPSATWGKSSPMTSLTCGAAAVVMSVNSGSEHALVAASVMSLNSRVQKTAGLYSGPKYKKQYLSEHPKYKLVKKLKYLTCVLQ